MLRQRLFRLRRMHSGSFDHGVFVPLMLMYPQADIPCLQLSLLTSLDPAQHIALGQSIRQIREQNVLVIGSGLSFHNLREFRNAQPEVAKRALDFDHWLIETCTSADLDYATRVKRLTDWTAAPQARFCHPREEHLLPLHVCLGAADETEQAELVFNDEVLGKQVSGFLWR
ncbi:MAG: class III extradiol ring-cleavage dioxygenase [Thiolinea sp.]